MRKLFLNTVEEKTEEYWENLRAMTPEQKFKETIRLTNHFIRQTKAEIRKSHPNITEDKLNYLFIKKLNGSRKAKRFLRLKLARDKAASANNSLIKENS